MQRSTSGASSGEASDKHIVLAKSDRQVEIIIKLQGVGETGMNVNKQPKPQQELRSNGEKKTVKISSSSVPSQIINKPLEGQNSYDSHSTAYHSLPSAIMNEADAIARRNKQSKRNPTQRATVQADLKSGKNNVRLNPIIAQYVTRLLGMTRKSIVELDVSSSDIATPSDSVLNTAANRLPCDEMIVSQERLDRVQKFVELNRSFINELEETLHSSQSQSSLEESMRAFEEIWTKRLRAQCKQSSGESVKGSSLGEEESVGEEECEEDEKEEEEEEGGEEAEEEITSKASSAIKTKEKEKRSAGLAAGYQNQKRLSGNLLKRVRCMETNEKNGESLNRGISTISGTDTSAFRGSAAVLLKDRSKSDSAMRQQSDTRLKKVGSSDKLTKMTSDLTNSAAALKSNKSNGAVKRPEKMKLYMKEGRSAGTKGSPSCSGEQKAALQKERSTNVASVSRDERIDATLRERKSVDRALQKKSASVLQKEKSKINCSISKLKEIESHLIDKRRGIPTVTSSDEFYTESHIARYAQLAGNCTNRIAELNELINKVREEKQRLLEVTLSSTSELERNSTEYLELPDDKNRARTADDQSSVRTESKALDSKSTNYDLPISSREFQAENDALVKGKQTGISRDSGISGISRPVTAQGQNVDMEPISNASSSQASSQRKCKPPPTLIRYSPQLIEDEVPHELSTIVEVDTPITSRINTLLPVETEAANISKDNEYSRMNQYPVPLTFPTFEQYAHEHNLDLTLMQPEQSERLQREFDELIAIIQEMPQRGAFIYQEFPSLNAYLHNLTGQPCDFNDKHHEQNTPENIEELLNCLSTAKVALRSFPTRHEYMRLQITDDPECGFIDTASLENLSAYPPETESEPINELQRRIYRSRSAAAAGRQICSSTICSGSDRAHIQLCAQMVAIESGIEKLSTSDTLSSDLERELQALGMQWPLSMRRKIKATEAILSDTSTSLTFNSRGTSPVPQKHRKNRSKNASATGKQAKQHQTSDEQYDNIARPINLREFLTRELLKHSNSTSCTDDSLSSNFLNSLLGNLTPNCTPRGNEAAGGSNNQAGQRTTSNLERQKTSTPRLHSAETTTTSTQLFSGESRISSVHFQDRTSVHIYTKEDDKKEREEH